MTTAMANDFYAQPENQRPAGPAVKRGRAGLSSHVPVRFSPEVIALVKLIAEREGMTVSGWIRRLVEREVQRLNPPTTGQWTTGTFEIASITPLHHFDTNTSSLAKAEAL